MRAPVYNGPKNVRVMNVPDAQTGALTDVDAYRHFDNREDGWTKVVLKLAMSN